ncbi:hypothetical protein GNP63_03345 [Aliivibrio fischeri]|uniref:hypothetical protein n=1 Tax=Aliivibrio fischeri TaxID=668 RepID=UPI0012D9E18D|nr:hypothetical protein [Aliivibrio fischeri]MUH95590.1 hypothetical protein [Aliivibrio fischeri]MUI64281.1 hypothetical protein [Aliivibrio fischeri]
MENKLNESNLTKVEIVKRLNKFDLAFFSLDTITLSRWSKNKTKPSNYRQFLMYLFFKDNISNCMRFNRSLNSSSVEVDKIVDVYFKYRKNPSYDKPLINEDSIIYYYNIYNELEIREVFSYFYNNFGFYIDIYDFIDRHGLKYNSYLFKEYDVKNERITSHIQASFLNVKNSYCFKSFLLDKNVNVNLEKDEELIIVDIPFFREKKTFEELLFIFIEKLIELDYVNHSIYFFCVSDYFVNILELLGGKHIGTIQDSANNIFIYKNNTLRLLSNKYIVELYRKLSSKNECLD